MSIIAASSASGGHRIVEGELLFTQDDFRHIASVLHGDCGIALTETKATLVYSRLAKRLRALGLETFRDYCALIVTKQGLDERQAMMAALTTNVTSFFRENHHFDHLRTKVLPRLIDHAKKGGRVRLWSAACSTGQEPYSIALTLLSLCPEAAGYDIRILATDIDPNVVAEGRRGIYSDVIVSPVPEAFKNRWMSKVQEGGETRWSLGEKARELVSFRELNLIGRWPMKGQFDLIFCRNVVIYFEEETQAKVWSRFAEKLLPGGRLYIGHSERLNGPAAAQFSGDGLTTYQLKDRER